MSIRLLIAEDEKVERQALRTLISREFPDTEIIDDALNGIDLIKKATEYKPDIIITDIRMPGLNGLSAVSRLKENGYPGKIIVQTAYSEFGYAREALELDAQAYLLKPIKQDRVREVISETIRQIQNEKNSEDLRLQQQEILEKAVPLLDAEMISSIQLNEIPPEFMKSYLRQRRIPLAHLCVLTLQTADEEYSMRAVENHENLVKAADIIRGISCDELRFATGRPSNNKISLLTGSAMNDEYKVKLDAIDFADAILSALNRTGGHPGEFRIGIGRAVSCIYNLNQAYKESLTALRFCNNNSLIQHYGDLNPDNDFVPPMITGETDLLNSILNCDSSAIAEQISRYLDNPVFRQLPLNSLKDSLLDSLVDLFKQVSALQPSFSRRMETYSVFLTRLSDCGNEDDVRKWFGDEIELIAGNYLSQSRDRVHRCVRKARDYIEKNYMKNISLDIVAEEIGVSPYHLSHLFKQELNQNYIKYLTDLRIRKAEEFISVSQYSLAELCRLTGYNNPSYFSKVFRKVTGKVIREINGVCIVISAD